VTSTHSAAHSLSSQIQRSSLSSLLDSYYSAGLSTLVGYSMSYIQEK